MGKRLILTVPFDGKRSNAILVHEHTNRDGGAELYSVTDTHHGFFPWFNTADTAAEAMSMALARAAWGLVVIEPDDTIDGQS